MFLKCWSGTYRGPRGNTIWGGGSINKAKLSKGSMVSESLRNNGSS